MNFENLMLDNTMCAYILKLVIIPYIISLILYLGCRCVKKDIANSFQFNIIYLESIPKILLDALAIFLIFCWNYKNMSLKISIGDKMLLTTFLVGAMAIVDLISTIVSLIDKVKEMQENKINKKLDELEKRIDKWEQNEKK